jgi:hypothetical protein
MCKRDERDAVYLYKPHEDEGWFEIGKELYDEYQENEVDEKYLRVLYEG